MEDNSNVLMDGILCNRITSICITPFYGTPYDLDKILSSIQDLQTSNEELKNESLVLKSLIKDLYKLIDEEPNSEIKIEN